MENSQNTGTFLKDRALVSSNDIVSKGTGYHDGLRQVREIGFDFTNDERDMYRLGKNQDLKRRFGFFSIAAFVITLGLTWEFSFTTVVFGLANGGTAGAIWLTFAVCVGMFFTMLSMAECASMAPTAGGPYHWVSEFAPRKYQKLISYSVGWLSAIGWQAAMPSVAYIGALQIVALISVCDSNYQPQGWHTALLTMAFILSAISFNTFAIGILPIFEGVAVFLHIVGFFAFIILLWVMGPRDDAKDVWFHFEDKNNWGSVGFATLVGIVGPVVTFVGADSAVHLGEELVDASYVLPRAMFSAAVINYGIGFVATVTLVSNLGNLDEVLDTTTGQPWVAVMQNATGSTAATIVLVVVMIFMYFFCAVNQVTTTSRQIYAFARDKGLPFHHFISRVNTNGVPVNSIYVTLVFTCLIALIIVGSSAAFNIILSIGGAGLYAAYLMVVVCMIARRFSNEPFPPTKFDLGKFGLPVNVIAVLFLSVAFVFLFFPPAPSPTVATMNWVSLMFGGTLIIAGLWYVFKARLEYQGPVTTVREMPLAT